MRIIGIEHVQLAMPAGEEDRARSFYSGILGIPEVPKPAKLAQRGGVWFENKYLRIHLGVEADFRPARKAHPALRCRNYASLIANLARNGIACEEVNDIPGVRRCHVHDPFGNRIELLGAD